MPGMVPERHRMKNPLSQAVPEGLWVNSVHPVIRADSHFGHSKLKQWVAETQIQLSLPSLSLNAASAVFRKLPV